ncbi:hypothetical protein BHM03_00054555 [Ensete ventricosum]|nr:hypothetical protein BHM03_00054555 [Ensete ventricosum]
MATKRLRVELDQNDTDLTARTGAIGLRPTQLRIEEVEESSNWQLVFTRPISPQIYTKGKVEDEDNRPLQVKLVDTRTGESPAISPPSPLKVEAVVLTGDFPSRDDDDWTAEEFNRNVVKQREGRPQLLGGKRKVAILMCRTNNLFTVYKKHNPPLPHDEVWRLKKIAKDGVFHRSLRNANVRTVQEFLRLLNNDRNTLRSVSNSSVDEMFFEVYAILIVSFIRFYTACRTRPGK